ncbi:MAG: bifunctional folylpolyglutamate synthase/dihydrofolate synthase [Clostridia bacterium]|nr:bifunctional folylpolyglutamate synthase/dihydrofolate synthase [Clostridia bacterium]
MTYSETIDYIHARGGAKCKPDLSRMRRLLARLGNPQDALHCIHVAGTNGKGSVCAMLDCVLRCAGYRVGLFTSPYIRHFEERVRVDGQSIDRETLAELGTLTKRAIEECGEEFSEFEVITAIGFLYFARQKVDYVVLEVGLGGRLDPTNVIVCPVLSVITGIDFDHTAVLGNTIQSIATEKAGIIKQGRPCVFGGSDGIACRTVEGIAAAKGAPFYAVDHALLCVSRMDLDGTVLSFGGYTDLRISLLGTYQKENAATVLTALSVLEQEGIRIGEDAVRNGLATVAWPSRFELMRKDPVVICDGGHNPQGVGAAVASVREYFPDQRVNVLTGVMVDKSYREMIERLMPVTHRAYTVTPQNPRALPAKEYAAQLLSHGVDAVAFDSIKEGLQAAIDASRKEKRPLLCLGSLYLYGSIAELLEQMGN